MQPRIADINDGIQLEWDAPLDDVAASYKFILTFDPDGGTSKELQEITVARGNAALVIEPATANTVRKFTTTIDKNWLTGQDCTDTPDKCDNGRWVKLPPAALMGCIEIAGRCQGAACPYTWEPHPLHIH